MQIHLNTCVLLYGMAFPCKVTEKYHFVQHCEPVKKDCDLYPAVKLQNTGPRLKTDGYIFGGLFGSVVNAEPNKLLLHIKDVA